ncbi:MAG: ribosomal protein S18-alanine N-acetyltransferase [Eubacteriales bacterium]
MIVIREMTNGDIDSIIEIEKSCFTNPWSKESFNQELRNRLSLYLIIAVNKDIIGYAGLWKIMDEGHITNIAIKKQYQSKGYGYKLALALLNEGKKRKIKRFTLEVRKSNISAIKLYSKIGFKKNGTRNNYYTNPKEDAIIMWYED